MPRKLRSRSENKPKTSKPKGRAAAEVVPFIVHGRDPKCDPEIAHTIVELIDSVAHEFKDDSWYWESSDELSEQKRKKNYRAKVNAAHLEEAWELLKAKKWLSLQNINARKKISTLEPLYGLQNVESLILTDNAIADISVLAGMTQLKELHMTSNRVRDLSALSACQLLKDLEIGNNPVKNLLVLQTLPRLQSLRISQNQLPALYQCQSLPSLRRLWILGDVETRDPDIDFRKLPEMAQLRWLRTDGVAAVEGIERFPGLVEMELFEGETGAGFGLEAVGQLKKLKSAGLLSYGHLDVAPMSTCVQLRSLNVTATTVSGLESLKRLPVLHEVRIDKRTKQLPETEASVPDDLSSWDTEFAAEVPRPSPNFEVEIVSQREFDRYDSKQAFGIDPKESDDGLLRHERDWLLGRIEDALQVDLTPEEDFVVPFQNREARSHTFVILSLKAYESVRSIAAAIQAELCASKKDWIIYFQALPDEGPDADELPKGVKNFTVWIYPDKLVATRTDAAVISRLLVP